MSRLTREGAAEPVSRDHILRRERGQGNIHFPCSADHEQDWQPSYPADPYSCYMCDHTYIHSFVLQQALSLRTRHHLCRQGVALASTRQPHAQGPASVQAHRTGGVTGSEGQESANGVGGGNGDGGGEP